MRKIKGYVKKHRGILALLCIVLLFQLCFLLINEVTTGDLVYFLTLEFLTILVALGIDFACYCKKYHALAHLLDCDVADQDVVSETGDLVEDAYVELIQKQASARRKQENLFREKSKEMTAYYNMWVHQIKTPIAGMNLVLQSMEASEESNELKNQMFYVEQYVDMALQYQRMQAEGNDFAFVQTPLNTVIRENIRKYAKLFISKKLAVQYEETDLKVLTDEKWLSFVIGQILTNAIKYSKAGAISFSVWEDDSQCYLSVKDQGIGISPEDLPRVFERGYTGYNGRANKTSTGIGLFLCKEIMTKLGHSIRIESELNLGTEVILGFSKSKLDTRD